MQGQAVGGALAGGEENVAPLLALQRSRIGEIVGRLKSHDVAIRLGSGVFPENNVRQGAGINRDHKTPLTIGHAEQYRRLAIGITV